METPQLKNIIEAALLAAGRPLDLNELQSLFGDDAPPSKDDIREAMGALDADYAERGIMVQEVASGYRIQVRPTMSGWLARLWEERTPRYSRALMETLAIIAYRQPVTRGDVEDIRGVGVTTNIMRTLLERNWIRVVGYRDVPGKPAIYGTTREFLDYFGLRRLDDLPPLADLKDLESLTAELDLAVEGQLAGGLPALPSPDEPVEQGEPATVTSIAEIRDEIHRGDEHAAAVEPQPEEPEDSATVIPFKVG